MADFENLTINVGLEQVVPGVIQLRLAVDALTTAIRSCTEAVEQLNRVVVSADEHAAPPS